MYATHCITYENEIKNKSIVKGSGVFNYSNVDEFVNIATAEGFSVFEHTLGWYSKKTAGYVKSYTCITVWGVNDANNWWLN